MSLHSFLKVHWGEDDARHDDKLATYFVKVPAYNDIILGRRRFVIGRKGTGKTALLERIRISAAEEHRDTWHISNLSLRSFPLTLVRELRDKSYKDKSQYVPVWTFLIAFELARLVVQSNLKSDDPPIKALRDFIKGNFSKEISGFSDALQRLSELGGQLQVPYVGTLGSKTTSQQVYQRHYHQSTQFLLDHLRKVPSTSTYYVLIDELDEGFRAGDPNNRLLLLALLRAVEDVARFLKSADPHYRVILALRDDIFDSLEDADLNKLDDFVVRLQWSSASDSNEYSRLPLKDIVHARVRASLDLRESEDPWTAIVVDDDPRLPRPVKSVWNYIADRSYQRPRDIIKFLKFCGESRKAQGKLLFTDVRAAENAYSAWLYRELRDELQSFLPVWKEALQAISHLGSGKVRTSSFKSRLALNPEIDAWCKSNNRTIDDIITLLFDYGVIGTLANRVWSFKYKDSALAWNPRAQYTIVHWGLWQKLRLFSMNPSND